MCPIWAVERVRAEWMRKSNAILETSQLEFHMGFKMTEFLCVSVGVVSGSSVAIDLSLRVPLMTNTRALKKGTRLFFEVAARPPKDRRKKLESWKIDVGNATSAAKKQRTQSDFKTIVHRQTRSLSPIPARER